MDRPSNETIPDIPKEILSEYRDVHLDIDIMFINKMPFFTAVSRDLRLTHCRNIDKRDGKYVLQTLRSIMKEYTPRGFKVVSAFGDNEFRPLKEMLRSEDQVALETCDTDTHVPAVERTNRFLKERIRCIRCKMPFKRIPRQLMREIAIRAADLINSIPQKGGVHNAMSAR